MKQKMTLFLLRNVLLALPLPALAALENPLGTTNVYEFIGRLIRALLGLSGAAALLMFVRGGFLWLTSRGESTQVNKGKETLKWAVFGLVIIFTAYILVNAIITGLTQGTALETPPVTETKPK